jgi:hypothetical protein
LNLGPFSAADARALGVPRSRLRRADLDAPFRGVRTASVPLTLLDRVRAYAPLLREAHFLSHGSAAVAWGMWLPRRIRDEAIIDVLCVPPARPPRMRGVRGHYSERRIDVAFVGGTPVVAATVAWCQLAEALSLDELVAAGDSLVRRKDPMCSVGQLAAAVAEYAGQPGAPLLRKALPFVRHGADSPKETDLRLLLGRAGLPEPAVNAVVSRPGARTRLGDLVFAEWRVIVEYDGEHHRRDPRQYAADIERLEELAALGWTVVRVLAVHFDAPETIVARVVSALRANGWRGRVSRSQLWRRLPGDSS